MPDQYHEDDGDDWAWFEDERLHRAAANGDIDELARLVGQGHAIARFDDRQRTPLHHAAEAGRRDAAAWLLAQGADVDAKDEDRIGETPLSLAVQANRPDMVDLLLRHGADPDIPGWMNLTARRRALEREGEPGSTIRALLARHAPHGGR